MRALRHPVPVLLLILVTAHPLPAQSHDGPPADTTGAFIDAGAATLLRRAREARDHTDRSMASYSAIVRSRFAAALRTPLKDRMLFREESAARVRWSRDGEHIVQLLGARTQTPAGVRATRHVPFPMNNLFDPAHDRLYFGFHPVNDRRDDDDFWIEHPLAPLAEQHYRFRSGDTLTLRLQGGHTVRVIELQVIPRRSDPHTVRGALWIDTHSGALVQSAFRLARRVDLVRDLVIDDDDLEVVGRMPLLNPMEFDISLLTVEYALWELNHWLPRTMRFDGDVRTGVLRFPTSAAVSYEMTAVEIDAPGSTPRSPEEEAAAVAATLAEWLASGNGDELRETRSRANRQRYRVLAPRDRSVLIESVDLPPPVWSDAPGFATEAELRDIQKRVSAVPGTPDPRIPARLAYGLREPDLARYNRVEALSLGARVTAALPPGSLEATARLGLGDLHPNVSLGLVRRGDVRTLEFRVYHELASTDPSRASLGPGNSLSALLTGRDEGEYFRASGGALGLAPPAAARRWWDVSLYGERHRAVERNTHIALPRLWRDSVFRENIAAAAADQLGLLINVRPWWGSDPQRAQFGADAMLQGEVGDFEHARGRVTLRAAAPLGAGARVAAEVGAGTSEGDVPVQRHFFLGGASTLRGYEPSIVSGTSMARGRLEVGRAWPFANLVVFSDWGWAGERGAARSADALWSVGAGASLLDGLLRVDLARGMRGPRSWRVDLHVDAVM